MAVETSIIDLRHTIAKEEVDNLVNRLREDNKVIFRVYALPWRTFKIRSVKKRLVEVDKGKLARLEYSLLKLYAINGSILFRDFAVLVGDYKAAVGYLFYMTEEGIITAEDQDAIMLLHKAHAPLSQKRYERSIEKLLDKKFTLNEDKVLKLGRDMLPCIFDDESKSILCRYLTSNARREQAKAQVRVFNETISEKTSK